MHSYRTHSCNALRLDDVGATARLSGWVHRKRDHGNLLFVDLRDHFGLTQLVVDRSSPQFATLEGLSLESVITVTGTVVARTEETVNPNIETGRVELSVEAVEVRSAAAQLPFPVNSDQPYPEDMRLRHRYLDLRRERNHWIVQRRSEIVSSIRRAMVDAGFLEITTPILTATSPEGARDYVVPARLHPGKFYALPQAPQMFKQLLMVSGFDRYFQIAPCFRDEAARADRSPGEFYQLDIEMSFVEQEDVLTTMEGVLHSVFDEHADKPVDAMPWRRIPYAESLLKYGSDKPDLRNPLVIADVTEAFRGSDFGIFAKAIDGGAVVRAIPAPGAAERPRSFFDKMNDWAREEMEAAGLGYVVFGADGEARGPIAKRLTADRLAAIKDGAGLADGDAVFFACDHPGPAARLAGQARLKLGLDLGLTELDAFRFCWIVDFPMYELDEDTEQVVFSHNPFSMPQGGLDDLLNKNPLEVLGWQYDVVCNGMELGSGAIRNHVPEIMFKAFEIAGYSEAETEQTFGSLLRAFRYGAPPHGGMAPGIDRIVMLLCGLPNIREGIAFPMSQQVEDLLMGAPTEISDKHLRELHLRVALPPKMKQQQTAEATGGDD
ncbi:MAG: aspartate--tRNA ligase [Alphaproteobacteria bacterium]|jgi:aspartyl-tRNA synthetase|nr:aspartate--tRNA ligase [Alphaproteobacteria bacterium]